jgi:hypothetical protein
LSGAKIGLRELHPHSFGLHQPTIPLPANHGEKKMLAVPDVSGRWDWGLVTTCSSAGTLATNMANRAEGGALGAAEKVN